MPKYRYLEDEISVTKISSLLGITPAQVTIGDIEVDSISTTHGNIAITKKGIEIEFPDNLSASALTALDNLLKSKNLIRK